MILQTSQTEVLIIGSSFLTIADIYLEFKWFSRNSKSHFASNLLDNKRTNLTLIVLSGNKSGLLMEQYSKCLFIEN